MKTWEMIKELTENPKKKFEGVIYYDYVNYEYSKIELAIWVNQDWNTFESETKHFRGEDYIFDFQSYNDGFPPLSLDAIKRIEWEEVKEPVTWQEALETWAKKDKEIYCIVDEQMFKYPKESIQSNLRDYRWNSGITKSELLEGKWYIED